MRSRAWSTVLLSLVVLLSACGDNSGGRQAQPSEDQPTFVEGTFGKVPVHPLAEPVGPQSTKNGVTAESFDLGGTSREQLYEWYADNLDGWVEETKPAPIADGPSAAWRGTWTKAEWRLVVTASEAPALSEGASSGDSLLQYSLSLEPRDR